MILFLNTHPIIVTFCFAMTFFVLGLGCMHVYNIITNPMRNKKKADLITGGIISELLRDIQYLEVELEKTQTNKKECEARVKSMLHLSEKITSIAANKSEVF